jgi:hypothetical protein
MVSTTPSRKPSAIKKRTAAKMAFANAGFNASDVSIGDVVILKSSDGTLSVPGRLCAKNMVSNTACVNFPGLGCAKVSRSRLSLAPVGSLAPNCDGCDDC